MKINASLSAGSLSKAADKLRKYAESIEPKTEKLVGRLGELGKAYANIYLEHDDTGATRSSIDYVQDGLSGTLSVGGAAVWIEFGTGVIANAGNSPHEKRGEVGAAAWGEYGKGLGKGVWEFPSRHAGMWIPTKGIPMNPFMLLTAKSLRDELTKTAREVFKND